MPAWLLSIAAWVLGKLFGNPSAPTSAEVIAKDDGEKAADIAGLENENAQLKAAAAIRSDADAARVRSDPSANVVTTDPDAPINKLPGEVFRD